MQRRAIAGAVILAALLAACGRGPGTPDEDEAPEDRPSSVEHPGAHPEAAGAPEGWGPVPEPVVDWERLLGDDDGDDGVAGSGSPCGRLGARLAAGESVLYDGQCHSKGWEYYTKDARTKGNRGGVTVWPNFLDGRENGTFVCGHDNDEVLSDGLWCSENAEWALVGG